MSDRTRRLVLTIVLGPSIGLMVLAGFSKGSRVLVFAGLAVTAFLIGVAAVYLWERGQPPFEPDAGVVSEEADGELAPRPEEAPGVSASGGWAAGLSDAEPARGATATEYSASLDVGARWDEESPDTWLVQRDEGAALILRPHPDDEDRRLVVLVWTPCAAVLMGPPDGAAKRRHRLYGSGLRECQWLAEVHDSAWVALLAAQEGVHLGDAPSVCANMRHFIVLTKRRTVEVVAPSVVVHRVASIRMATEAADL